MNKKIIFLLLFVGVFVGGLIRFIGLGNQNQGFFRDEAALGFNSWSILNTGADEYGKKMPIFFRSFEVFFMPAYSYLSVPFFYLFGPTEFSTRFLSALSGTILIFFSYLIAKELFKSEKIAFLTSLVVSLSPWAIFYSRGAFEGNLALLFFCFGFYFWLKFQNSQQNKYFFYCIIFFVFSMYSYQSPRFVVPVFLFLSVLFTKRWQKKLKLWIFGVAFAVLLYYPILIYSFSSAGYSRAKNVSLFSGKADFPGASQQLGQYQYLYLVPRELFSLYLHYFSPGNLFSQSDYNPQRRVPYSSVFYLWQLPFLLIGFWFLIHSDFKNKRYFLIWLLIAPIPAALTKDPFHTYRAILFFMPISILIGLGIYKTIESFKKNKIIIYLILFIVASYSVSNFIFNLKTMMPIISWRDWDFGYKQISQIIKAQPENFRVIIDDENTESYIHFLFYGLIQPEEYQKEASKFVSGRYYISEEKLRPQKIGRFEFRKVDWRSERGDKETIFIFPSNRFSTTAFAGDPKLSLIGTVNSPSGDPAYFIIKSLNKNMTVD